MDAFAGGACALLSAAIWAFSSTFMTIPARLYGGRAMNLFKSTVAAPFFFVAILVWLGPDAFRVSLPVWGKFALSGVIGLAIADTAYLSGLKHIGPTLTAIVYETSGIFTAVLGAVLLHETMDGLEILGMGLVIGGALLALLDHPSPHVPPGHRVRGALYALFAAAFQATGLIFNKAALADLESFNGTKDLRAAMTAGFARMTAAMIALLLFGLLTGSLLRQTRPLREGAGWRASFLPAVAGSFVAMITMQFAISNLKAGTAAVLLSMTPIFTIPVEWSILKRRPSARAIAGAVIAIAGAYLLTRRR